MTTATAPVASTPSSEVVHKAPPTTFLDPTGREWKLIFNMRVVRALTQQGKNFHGLAEKRCAKFLALENDDEELLKWLWWSVKATEPGQNPEVTEREFIDELFDGRTLYAAWEVFSDAYVNFTRDQGTASALREALAKNKEVQDRGIKMLQEKADRLRAIAIAEQDRQAAQMTDQKLKEMLTGSPEPKPNESSTVSLGSSTTPQESGT